MRGHASRLPRHPKRPPPPRLPLLVRRMLRLTHTFRITKGQVVAEAQAKPPAPPAAIPYKFGTLIEFPQRLAAFKLTPVTGVEAPGVYGRKRQRSDCTDPTFTVQRSKRKKKMQILQRDVDSVLESLEREASSPTRRPYSTKQRARRLDFGQTRAEQESPDLDLFEFAALTSLNSVNFKAVKKVSYVPTTRVSVVVLASPFGGTGKGKGGGVGCTVGVSPR